MRMLFLARRYRYLSNFESVIHELASQGHQIHLAVEHDTADGEPEPRPSGIEHLITTFPNVTCGDAPSRTDGWSWVASRLRTGIDHLRYQHPMFDGAPKLVDRSRERTPGAFVALGRAVRWVRWIRRPASMLLHRIERALPEDRAIRAFIEAQRPDVLLLTPLIDLGSWQIDYLRAARSLDIPTALCVWSWDHLSSKGLIRESPDRVFVWNETQKREAVELHGVAPDRVAVTGAQCFDIWFDRRPSRDREAFCQQLGFPSDRPFILYVCSALLLGSPPERPFVLQWIRRVRASDSPVLQSAPILVRPHPSRMREWEGIDLSSLRDVVRWGDRPLDGGSRADYFDSLHHSTAVVGLNTSAFIEAAIAGRPVYTLMPPEFFENQMGTIHFRYLLQIGGGLLTVARDFDEHVRQLADAVAQPRTIVRPFVREFVRPHGLSVAATPLFVQQVEGMRGLCTTPPRTDILAPVWRWLAGGLLKMRSARWCERWLYSQRELAEIASMRDAHARKARIAAERRAVAHAAKAARREARRREWDEHRRRKAAADAQKKAQKKSPATSPPCGTSN